MACSRWRPPPPQVAQTAQRALDALVRKVPNVTQWIMHLPDDRDPAVNILWRDTGNGRFETLRMHPQTGEAIDTRQTMGGDFFYRFHFELRTAQEGRWTREGRWVVGVATMMMFVALISGVVVGGAGRPRRGDGLVWPTARTKADASSAEPPRRRGVLSGFWLSA